MSVCEWTQNKQAAQNVPLGSSSGDALQKISRLFSVYFCFLESICVALHGKWGIYFTSKQGVLPQKVEKNNEMLWNSQFN